jgi:sigma54-dependent transcription regulator
VSDLMFEEQSRSLLGKLAPYGHELAVFHLLSRQELTPELDADATLVSIESGAALRVRFDTEAQRAYAARVTSWQRRCQDELRARGQRYFGSVAGADLGTGVRSYVWSLLRRA